MHGQPATRGIFQRIGRFSKCPLPQNSARFIKRCNHRVAINRINLTVLCDGRGGNLMAFVIARSNPARPTQCQLGGKLGMCRYMLRIATLMGPG